MAKRKIHGHPVLIIGAGRGGSALLEMFMEDSLVEVVAIADPNLDAPGMKLAASHGIPTYANAGEALRACKDYPDCIVYNLSHDDAIADEVGKVFGNKNVTSGLEAKLIWQMVTNLKRVKNEFEKSQSQLQAIIHNAMDGIITISELGEIQEFNPAAEKIFGYSRQEVMGQNVKMLMPEPVRSEHDNYLSRYIGTGQAHTLGVSGREVTAVRKNGEQFPMELSASEMVLRGERYFVGIVRDVTERKLAEQKIMHLAHHDYLTDLPNRALFLDRLEQSIALAKRSDYKEAILFLDLDGFKKVNDTLGHGTGDLLLQEVAKRLKKVIRSSDTVARVGGDEFTFVLNDIGTDEHAASVAANIIATLAEPFDLQGQQCHIGGSIGISIYPDDAHDFATLLRQADEAMYLTKQNGKNAYKFYRELHQEGKS
jgi:diguanylate cyclase (GGDEF)-like protein/PAS domain S-box-containing protein